MLSGIKRDPKGFSPVIASLILAVAVITMGGMVWAFSQSAMTVTADDYVEGVMNLMNEGAERFTIEHVRYCNESDTLYVWIYNYGDVDTVVDVYANVTGGAFECEMENEVASGAIFEVHISLDAASGSEVSIKAVSRRGNNAYYMYLVS